MFYLAKCQTVMQGVREGRGSALHFSSLTTKAVRAFYLCSAKHSLNIKHLKKLLI